MSVEDHFKLVTTFFSEHKVDYAVIGAFALHAYGFTRATRDIDFITRLESQPHIVGYMESLGFETLQRTIGFSNHLHAIEAARIDFMYVSGHTADQIFSSIIVKKVLGGLNLPVPSPEHYLALKLFAAKSNPNRRDKDLLDIKSLLHVVKIDRATVEMNFRKYGMEGALNGLFQ
jgi:hypothetical protein